MPSGNAPRPLYACKAKGNVINLSNLMKNSMTSAYMLYRLLRFGWLFSFRWQALSLALAKSAFLLIRSSLTQSESFSCCNRWRLSDGSLCTALATENALEFKDYSQYFNTVCVWCGAGAGAGAGASIYLPKPVILTCSRIISSRPPLRKLCGCSPCRKATNSCCRCGDERLSASAARFRLLLIR